METNKDNIEKGIDTLTEKYYECETCFYEPHMATVLGHVFLGGDAILPVNTYKCPKCGNYTIRKVRRKIWETLTLATIYEKKVSKRYKLNRCFHLNKRKGVAAAC